MNATRLLPLKMLLTASFVAGCDPELAGDAGDDETVALRPGGGGGIWLNTSSIGSKEFSAFDLNGALLDGARMTGAKIKVAGKFQTINVGDIVDGNIRVKVGKNYYTGAALVDSRWTISIPSYDYGQNDAQGITSDNHLRVVEMWISAYSAVSANEGRYTFQFLDEQGQPAYLCDADANGSRAIVPIKDIVVDPDTGDVTQRATTAYLACTSGAIGKAVVWGYKPWERSLADFEVASRMVRADYCYDGMSWTATGTPLQIRDAYGINDFLYESDPDEVLWTTSGVACLNQPRNSAYTASQITCDGQPLPVCPVDLTMTTYPGSLFWTKLGLVPEPS